VPAAIAFALIGGYTDAIGYLRYNAFAGMMTGNTVLMGLAFFHRAELPAWQYAALLALFFAAAIAAFVVLRHAPPAVLLVSEGFLILLADVVGTGWAIVFLVVAMGVQNPLAARCGVPLNTTFITGDILRFAEGVARHLRHGSPVPRGEPFAIYGLVWLAYALGAALGVATFRLVDQPLLLPAVLLAFVYAWNRHRLPPPTHNPS
jgi:uncharacterized membrane protein YoaK (UPF0700 family)